MKTITSRDNPTFKELRALACGVRRTREEGRALLDGPHLVTAALDKGLIPDLLTISESALANPEVGALLARVEAVPVLCLRDALFRELSELAHPVGILARIAVLPAPTFPVTGDCLLLDAVQDAGNVGTLLRTAAAAGVQDVLLSAGCAGAWSPRVLRAGQGAHFGLRIREQVDLLAFLKDYPGTSVAAVAHEGQALYALAFKQPTAWLFGSEGQGVSPELLAAVNQRATIPLAQGSESLNVGAAAAICLFEMRRQRTM
ncbi:MAG: RNA methyltransferase [Rhodocyclaceae bacterium]|nr:RNA methyltransferase [Rhodocyclaceae bacterium]MDZ4215386.1 RNA methyltransferase [Rhodocyclaceae bacterium]